MRRRRRSRAWMLGVVLFASGCAAKAPGVPPTPPLSPPDRGASLSKALDGVLGTAAFERAAVGLVVRSLDTGETLYARNGRTWLVPASTMKVLTAVAAADRLGWGFRFETRLVAMGPVVDGVLDGDLLVVGSGDPTINRRHPDRVDALDAWARTLHARGIRRIAGHVIGDDSHVVAPGWGIGWAWDDLLEDYGAANTALQINENVVTVTAGPGATPGGPAVVYLSPSNHGMLVDTTDAVTADAARAPSLSLSRDPGTRMLDVHARLPWGGAPLSTTIAAANPTLYFAGELRQALLRQGIAVDGVAVDIDEESDRPVASEGTTLLVDQSAPVRDIVREMLAWSINLYAESLITALDPRGPVTTADGLVVFRDTLTGLGVDGGGYSTRDGSGLSRNDYLSAHALVETLAGAWRSDRLREPLLAVLPTTGVPGTLERRLADTPGAGRVHAKTGSMSNVRSLAGYVETTAGERLAFAFIANGFDVRGAEIDRQVDTMLLALVALPRP